MADHDVSSLWNHVADLLAAGRPPLYEKNISVCFLSSSVPPLQVSDALILPCAVLPYPMSAVTDVLLGHPSVSSAHRRAVRHRLFRRLQSHSLLTFGDLFRLKGASFEMLGLEPQTL